MKTLVFVSAQMARTYFDEVRAIDQRFQALSEPPDGMSLEEHWRNMASLRFAARQSLRQELVEAVKQSEGGPYPIAV